MKTNEASQGELIEGLKQLDVNVVDGFVDRFSRPLFGVILNYTKNPPDAEEILQDTLLKIIRKIDTFRQESDIWPWMKKIAVNNSIMWLRKQTSSRKREVRLDDWMPQFNDEGELEYPVFSWTGDPEEVMLNRELSSQLYDAIQSLPFEYRAPLALRDIEGYPVKQISSLLGLKEATTKTRIHRARLFVRERLAHYFEGKQ
jgi:RNA polymerase sigma-70 factor (ECF subfamily)